MGKNKNSTRSPQNISEMFQIIWSDDAIENLSDIFEFWINNNSSEKYSIKILEEIKFYEILIVKNHLLGTETHYKNVRKVIILDNFSLYYTYFENIIQIISIWDNRRDPKTFTLR